jgi:hypothetical protein
LVGILPSALAQTGASAADAIPIGTDGKFAGTDALSSSLWYKFNYIGGNQTVTVTLTFEPADSNRLDIFLFTGDPSNPTQAPGASTLNGNVRTISYTDPGGVRVVFIKVENDHPDRSVSFVGSLAPTTAIATPTPTSASNPATPQATGGEQCGQRDHAGREQRRVLGHAEPRPGGLVPLLLRQPRRGCDG